MDFILLKGLVWRKKRDTPERMSHVFGVELGGQLQNRGCPWPREWEVVNEKRDIHWMSRSEQSQLGGI